MSQSLSSILIHMIFSTKNREPLITASIEKELHPYMATIFRELKSPFIPRLQRSVDLTCCFVAWGAAPGFCISRPWRSVC